MVLKVTEFKSLKSSTGSVVTTEWETMARKLSVPYKSEFTREQFLLMDKDAQAAEKEKSKAVIWGESIDGRRKKTSVPFRCALSLDYDDAPKDIIEKVSSVLEGVSYVIYSTIKSTADAPRVRVIIPTDRLIDGDEHDAIGRLICGRIGMQGADSSMLQNWRMMLLPAVLKGQEYIYKYNERKFLHPEDWLNKYADWRDISQRPLFEGEERSFKETKEKVSRCKKHGIPLTASDPRDKKGIVGAFCSAYSIEEAIKTFLPDVYEEGKDGRYTYIHGHGKNGVAIIDGVLAYSFHSTDPAGMQMVNAYDLVRIHKFGNRDADKFYSDISRRPSDVAMQAFAKMDKKVSEALRKKQAEKYKVNVTQEEIQMAIDLGFKDLPLTDMGTAKRLAGYLGHRVRYDTDRGCWFSYTNGIWKKENKISFLYEDVCKVADMTVSALLADGKQLEEDAERYQKYAGTNRNQRAVIDCLQALLGEESSSWDADYESLNCADGYVDLATGQFVDHDPNQLCRLQAGAMANGDIDPECIKFIESVLPDEETRDYMQRLCGYMLGSNNEQKLIILYGEKGNNGKSSFTNLLQDSLGSYAKTGSIDTLLTAKGDGDSERANPSLAMLQSARCVLMHENDYFRSLRSAQVKRITGNTPVVARYMYENFVEFTPRFTCVIDVNDAPTLQDSGDDAMRKRVRLIPFTAHFKGKNVDRSIEKKVHTQAWLNTFLMWALDGRQEYLKRGLDDYDGSMSVSASNLPKEVKEAMQQYFADSDDIGDYIECCLDITNDVNDFVTIRDLYDDYHDWVVGTPRTMNAFSTQIKKRFRNLYDIEQTTRHREADGVQERGYAGVKKLNADWVPRVVSR